MTEHIDTNKTMDLGFNTVVDYVKTNKLRRSRGYSFEYITVKKINAKEGWQCRRLGGSSTGLPDLVATQNDMGILLVFECKSADKWKISVPDDQVQRCMDTATLFGHYPHQYMIFAFKFKANKRERRPLSYRYLVIDPNKFIKIWDLDFNLKSDWGWFRFERPNGEKDGSNLKGISSALYEVLNRIERHIGSGHKQDTAPSLERLED